MRSRSVDQLEPWSRNNESLSLRDAAALALQFMGCTSSVEETEDSVRIEVEIPKVETGAQPPDLDPSTDDDIDVDTPLPGDS